MQRIALISDTHVSPTHGFFVDNVLQTIGEINAAGADLVVNCGDLSINGADDERELRFAAYLHKRIAAPLAIIPGNHDIGEEPGALHADQPISRARIARYEAAIGPDRWARDLGPWRLIGYNSMLAGTGLPEEHIQWAWLNGELAAAGGRPIGVFQHKPLWLEDPDEDPQPAWTLSPTNRDTYVAAFKTHGVRFIASGHLHQSRASHAHGLLHVWAPSCAFPGSRSLGGVTALGFALLDLADDGAASARFIAPPLVHHDYDAIRGGGVYATLKDCPPAPPAVDWPG